MCYNPMKGIAKTSSPRKKSLQLRKRVHVISLPNIPLLFVLLVHYGTHFTNLGIPRNLPPFQKAAEELAEKRLQALNLRGGTFVLYLSEPIVRKHVFVNNC